MKTDENAQKRIRVVLADDHPRVRKAVKDILDNSPDITVIGEAADGKEALQLTDELAPDVLLLDVIMPKLNGLQVVNRLQESQSPVRILVLSSFDDKQIIKGMIASGVSGYLIKEEAADELNRAVISVSREDNIWLSRKAAQKIGSATDDGSRTNHPGN